MCISLLCDRRVEPPNQDPIEDQLFTNQARAAGSGRRQDRICSLRPDSSRDEMRPTEKPTLAAIGLWDDARVACVPGESRIVVDTRSQPVRVNDA